MFCSFAGRSETLYQRDCLLFDDINIFVYGKCIILDIIFNLHSIHVILVKRLFIVILVVFIVTDAVIVV